MTSFAPRIPAVNSAPAENAPARAPGDRVVLEAGPDPAQRGQRQQHEVDGPRTVQGEAGDHAEGHRHDSGQDHGHRGGPVA